MIIFQVSYEMQCFSNFLSYLNFYAAKSDLGGAEIKMVHPI